MPLLRLNSVSLAFGHRALLDHINLEVHRGERLCLVGRNGEGKSSLLKILTGEIHADDGEVWLRPGMRISHLAQEVAGDRDELVFDIVAGGLPGIGKLISDYHHAVTELSDTSTEADLDKLSALQHKLETEDGWQLEQRVASILSKLELDGDIEFRSLSGGWRRRAMLARALVSEPDVLLLDEPTNHLDIEAIAWLEDFISEYKGALLFISHDRSFVRRLASRIIELDRGQLSSWPGNYDAYVRNKAEQLEVEAKQNALFDKRLSDEEKWIRKGIKARRTRNEGRVRALKAMREERRQRRERGGKARLGLERGNQSGKLVFEAENVSLSFDDHCVIRDFSTTIMRGDRIGIIGPNGAGKSTLIKVLLGQLQPDNGVVNQGTKLQVAYFDQQRESLDPDKSVMDNVADGSERVEINGNSRHVASYLRDFLFPPERLRSPVSTLSGGERNRLLLARLFAKPANLLVMDEPTNDLDVETLELLEELLMSYDGTLLLVSHDRTFLDNVVTSTLVFEDDGHIGEYVGGYQDWLRQRETIEATAATKSPATPKNEPAGGKKKLSYKDQRLLDELPGKIEELDSEKAELEQAVNEPEFYQQDADAVQQTLDRLQAIDKELETCYRQWESLE